MGNALALLVVEVTVVLFQISPPRSVAAAPPLHQHPRLLSKNDDDYSFLLDRLPLPDHIYDKILHPHANGNCSTTLFFKNSIISNKVTFNSFFWFLQNWCGKAAKPSTPADRLVEDHGGGALLFERLAQFLPDREVLVREDEELQQQAGAPAAAREQSGDHHAGDGGSSSDMGVFLLNTNPETGKPEPDVYTQFLQHARGDLTRFCNNKPSCEPGTCNWWFSQLESGIGRDIAEDKVNMCRDQSSPIRLSSSIAAAVLGRAVGGVEGGAPAPRTVAPMYESVTPMDVLEKLGGLANLRDYMPYNVFSAEHMMFSEHDAINHVR